MPYCEGTISLVICQVSFSMELVWLGAILKTLPAHLCIFIMYVHYRVNYSKIYFKHNNGSVTEYILVEIVIWSYSATSSIIINAFDVWNQLMNKDFTITFFPFAEVSRTTICFPTIQITDVQMRCIIQFWFVCMTSWHFFMILISSGRFCIWLVVFRLDTC